MGAKTFYQEFSGYWRERNKGGLPAASGIYCVYEGQYNPSSDQVTLLNLIYIGESGNVRERIEDHERTSDWRKHVRYGNELIFNSTLVQISDRQRVEAALIYEHKPPENIEYKNSFPYDTTTVYSSGCNALLKPNFTVYSTQNSFAGFLYR